MDHATPSVVLWVVSHCQDWNFYSYLLLHIWIFMSVFSDIKKTSALILQHLAALKFPRKSTLFCVVSNALNTPDSEIALCTCTHASTRGRALPVDPIWIKGSCDSWVQDETVGSVLLLRWLQEFVRLTVRIGKLESSSQPSQDMVESTKATADTITLKKKRKEASLSFFKHLTKWLKCSVLHPHQRKY